MDYLGLLEVGLSTVSVYMGIWATVIQDGKSCRINQGNQVPDIPYGIV